MDPSSSSQWASRPSTSASDYPQIPDNAVPGPSSQHRHLHQVNIAESSTLDTDGETQSVLREEQTIVDDAGDELYYRTYRSEEEDLSGITRLVDQELSEPYNIYTFRYFLVEWPHLTFLVFPTKHASEPIATIICKQESHRGKRNRGYIGMLSVDKAWRRRGIATKLVKLAIAEMASRGAHEICMETEWDNGSSLALYDSMGFMREKRIQHFYSNLKDAFRLILPLPTPDPPRETPQEAANARVHLSDPSHLPEPQSNTIPRNPFAHANDDMYT